MLSIKEPSESYQVTQLQANGSGANITATWSARAEADFLLCVSDGFRHAPSLEMLLEEMTPEQQKSFLHGTTVKLESARGVCVLQNVKWQHWVSSKKCELDIKGVLSAPLRVQAWPMKDGEIFSAANSKENSAAVRAFVIHKVVKPPFWKFFDRRIKSTVTVAGRRENFPAGCLEYRVNGSKRFSYPIPGDCLGREFAVKAKEITVRGAKGYEDLFQVRTEF